MKIGLIITALIGSGYFLLSHPYVKALTGNKGAEKNYQEYCASCHGEDLRSFVDRTWLYGNSWNEVYNSIKFGNDDDGMPAYDTTFNETELSDLTSYILTEIEDLTKDDLSQNSSNDEIVSTDKLKVKLNVIVSDLDIPWGLGFLPNGDLLITERDGDMIRYNPVTGLHPISGVPEVKAAGQGGLLDVELHPDFEQNNFVYLSYSKPVGSDATTAILRAQLKEDQLVNAKDIFVAEPAVSTKRHYGSRLEFDRDGYLFFSVGDRGRRDDHPQYLSNGSGKIHRIHDDGSIPADNPFVNDGDAVGSIWSYGHRNPQGLVMNPETGVMWANEHGPRGGDEVNEIEKGKNYGWPVISYGINYSGTKFTDITEKEGMLQPKHYWVPAIGVCGMAFIDGDRYPAWQGDIMNGSLAFGYVHRLEMDGNKVIAEEKLFKEIGRVRDIKMSPDGFLYITAENPGRVIRVEPM